jgi:glycyl-radical enzyme activating protein
VKKMIEGTVFDISRYCLDDGPGIRTTVYLKGCPLRCAWCHNPESNSKEIQIGFEKNKCVSCMACARVCPNHCHEFNNKGHIFHRENCIACGKCTNVCEYDSLTQIGQRMTVHQIMKTVVRDQSFYKTSGGGLTVSGGEALYQPEFTKLLLKSAKDAGIHTCMETSGFTNTETLLEIAPYVDLFLYDCKHMNSNIHKEITQVDNKIILDNLKQLDKIGKAIVLRLPVIPCINDTQEHFCKVGEFANQLTHVEYLEVLPYHPLGLSKAALLDMKMPYHSKEVPLAKTVDEWVKEIQSFTTKQVIHSKI